MPSVIEMSSESAAVFPDRGGFYDAVCPKAKFGKKDIIGGNT
jgi:hypothetical protein